MSFLPIVERELRIQARRPATHWLRFGIASVVLLIWMILALGAGRFTAPSELGQSLFIALSVLGLGFCLLAGVFLTSDCLSAERRDGTLGLLFLTDLHGFDVVLGKLVTTSLQAAYGLLAVLPMLSLSVLLGGVSGGEFARLVVALLGTLFLSLALGLAVSALSREASHAMLATFLVILALAAGAPTLSGLLHTFHLLSYSWNPLNWTSPVSAYALAFDSNYDSGRGHLHYLASVAALGVLGGAALWLACRRLPRHFDDAAGERQTDSRSAPSNRPAQLAQRSDNPYEWLASRDGRLRRVARMTLLVFLLGWLGCLVMALADDTGAKEFGFTVCMFGAFILHLLVKGFIAVEASRRFNQDRASGALELLLATPLPPESIVEGQHRAWVRFASLPVGIAVFVNLLLIWLISVPDPVRMGGERGIFIGILLGGGIALLCDAFAFGWTGMTAGLRHARQHRAVLVTLGKVMLPPWVAILLFVFLSIGGRGWSDEDVKGMIALWFLLSGGISLAVGFKAKTDLRFHFRRMAAGGPAEPGKPGPRETGGATAPEPA